MSKLVGIDRATMADKDAQTDLGFAVIDDGRAARTGLAEVVFGQGKTPEQLASILEHLVRTGHAGLATRVDLELAAAVRGAMKAPSEAEEDE